MKYLIILMFICLSGIILTGCGKSVNELEIPPNLLELEELEGFLIESDPVDRDDF